MSEDEAYRTIQKYSMNSRKSMRQVARRLLPPRRLRENNGLAYFFTAFTTILVAELADKTEMAILSMTAKTKSLGRYFAGRCLRLRWQPF